MIAAAMDCRLSAGSDAERCYLESLNVCFPAWGGRERFDWCFSRESAGMRPDLMMLHGAGGAVAGLAHAYRRIRLPNGQVMRACLMIGAWTLPEARGRGAFTRLIGESIELAAARQVGLLLAYFARTSPSAGRMRAAGAALFPSWHIRSPAERRIAVDGRAVGSADATGGVIADRIEDHQDVADAVRLVYTADEWRDQFVLRPDPVTRVLDGGRPSRWSALVERTALFDRVLSLTFSEPAREGDAAWNAWADAIAVLDARAAAAGRRIFCYTTDPQQASVMRSRGFEIVDGYVSALVGNQATLRAAFANGSGGKLPAAPSSPASHVLADPASPWYLGRLFMRNGDRM